MIKIERVPDRAVALIWHLRTDQETSSASRLLGKFLSFPLIVFFLSGSFAEARGQSNVVSANVRQRYQQLANRFEGQLKQLATKYEDQGQSEAGVAIRELLVPREEELLTVQVFQTNGQPAAATPPAPRQEWQVALTRIRKQHAKELFDLAATAFRAGEVSLSYDLVREVIVHDQDHGSARSLMGHTKHRDQWVTPYAATKLKSGQIWDARFGWIPKNQLPRLENGEQLWKGQWLPASEVTRYRSGWASAWEIETEHYTVKTNVSLERGVEFAAKLEKLYAMFFRLFAGFFSPREQLALMFDPPNRRTAAGKTDDVARRQPKRFRVNFYRARDEYMETLRPFVKTGLDISTGMYLTGTHTAYFYVHEQMDESTVIHEATHQLFSECRDHRNGDGSRGNYWVLEGIACYMESFRDRGDRVELGTWDTPRLMAARRRMQKFIPLERLVQLDLKDFEGPDVVDLYVQSAALCHFFMHHDGGSSREAFVKYLEEVYLGRANYQSLTDLVGSDFATLERQFLEHVTQGKTR